MIDKVLEMSWYLPPVILKISWMPSCRRYYPLITQTLILPVCSRAGVRESIQEFSFNYAGSWVLRSSPKISGVASVKILDCFTVSISCIIILCIVQAQQEAGQSATFSVECLATRYGWCKN